MGKTSNRGLKGGTTALVVVLTLVVIIVGVCFFFWMKIIGGNNELQHSVDSGNLSVAKSVLKSPLVPLALAEDNEFGGLTDTPGNVDLLSYNRFVAQALMVGLNAQAINTPQALANAQACANMVQGTTYSFTLPNGNTVTGTGIGQRLASQLSNNSNLSGFFNSLTQANNTRMLQSNSGVSSDSTQTEVSYMARGKASNVAILPNQVPSGSNVSSLIGVSKTLANRSQPTLYLAGYSAMSPCAGVSLQTVPMRPGEQPHLVDATDFQNEKVSPIPAGGSSLIPPNAFMSGGTSIEGNQTGAILKSSSSAIVGSVIQTIPPSATQVVDSYYSPPSSLPTGSPQDFPVAFSRGYIIVDNTGTQNLYDSYTPSSTSFTVGGGSSSAIMQLQPSIGIELAVPGSGPKVFGPPGSVAAVIADANNPKVSPTTFNNDLSQIKSPAQMTQAQALSDFQTTGTPAGTTLCTVQNTMGSGATPPCSDALSDFEAVYNVAQSPGTSVGANSLSAVEQFKCEVLQARSIVGDSGCQAVAKTFFPQTGLKNYDMSASQNGCPTNSEQPCNVYSSGTLNDLLKITNATNLMQTGAANLKVVNAKNGKTHLAGSNGNGALATRLFQISPTADTSSIMNSNVPFGQISFIYASPADPTQLVLSSTPPAFLSAQAIFPNTHPDGQPTSMSNSIAPFIPPTATGNSSSPYANPVCPAPMSCYSTIGSLDGTVFNLVSCEGYPHPWDCSDGGTGAWGMNSAQFTPSSGFNNLLGVLRLFNWAAVGGNWCCPC